MTKLMKTKTPKSPFKERVAATAHILRLDWVLYAMLLPTLVYFVLFRVLPIINMRLAFFTYSRKTAWEWAGLKYFRQIFSTPQFFTILENTLIISFMKYVLLFPFFVIFAILLSEMRMQRCRKVVQVISYLPHFLSWVVIAGIWISLLSYSGAVSQIVQLFGGQPKNFMTDKGLIRWILMISEGWRSIGWDSIIYFTTIISINPSLYESAEIDGASRMQVICHIVLPMLLAPMSTMFILNLGYFMSAGFDQVLNFTNSAVQSTIDILDTYIYRIGIQNGQYSLASAVGLFKGVVGMILVLLTHVVSKKVTGEGVW